MPRKQLDAYEARALESGGQHAGEYLDQLGRTDLAQLSPDEWQEFLARVLIGYSEAMRSMMTNHEAPF